MMSSLLAYLLASVGLTVLIVWPEKGPSAWIRDICVRPLLPKAAEPVLDCYVCCGFWTGLLLSGVWWQFYPPTWYWAGCLMVPGIFWMLLFTREE